MVLSKALRIFIAFSALVVEFGAVSATRFSYNNDMSCRSPASISVSSLSCKNDACDFGDKITATGTLDLSNDLPESVCLTLSNCFMGTFICKSYSEENVNICEYLSDANGSSECPTAGSYTFDADVEIPKLSKDVSLGSGWWVTSKIELNDCDSGTKYTSCKLSFKAVSSSGSSSTAAFIGVSAIGLATVALLLHKRRRRRIAGRIDLQREEELTAVTTNFQRMRDPDCGVSV